MWRKTTAGKDIWKTPPPGFLKINIDGASKGNIRMARYGDVIINEKGHIKNIFHNHLGTSTNNMAEFMAFEKCLEILMEENLQNVVIEDDFELFINVAKKMCKPSEHLPFFM